MKNYNSYRYNRKSLRLKGYDYSKTGLYFITICCKNRRHFFGEIKKGEMHLNELGQIAFNEWMKLPDRFPNFQMDAFQIMPNHIHAIINLIENPPGAVLAAALDINIENNDPEIRAGASPARIAISDIVGAYKSLVANECLKIFKSKNEIMGKLWHRNYYERIIYSDRSYYFISEYIKNNPANWHKNKISNR